MYSAMLQKAGKTAMVFTGAAVSEPREIYMPDPYEELRGLMSEEEVGQLLRLLRLMRDNSPEWGQIHLPFQKGRLTRATVEMSAVGLIDKPKNGV